MSSDKFLLICSIESLFPIPTDNNVHVITVPDDNNRSTTGHYIFYVYIFFF